MLINERHNLIVLELQKNPEITVKEMAEKLHFSEPTIRRDYTELEKRLRGRGTDAEESIVKRLANAKGEMAHWKAYDYIVINNDLEEAYRDLSRIIHALRKKSARYKEVPFYEF